MGHGLKRGRSSSPARGCSGGGGGRGAGAGAGARSGAERSGAASPRHSRSIPAASPRPRVQRGAGASLLAAARREMEKNTAAPAAAAARRRGNPRDTENENTRSCREFFFLTIIIYSCNHGNKQNPPLELRAQRVPALSAPTPLLGNPERGNCLEFIVRGKQTNINLSPRKFWISRVKLLIKRH